jgi:hypothetical protein
VSKFDSGYAIQGAAFLRKASGKDEYIQSDSPEAKRAGQELKARDIFNLREYMAMNDAERAEHLRSLESD